jgi:hypothetical protein
MGGMGAMCALAGWLRAFLLHFYFFFLASFGGISFYSVFLSRAFQILLEATSDQSGAGPVSILVSFLPSSTRLAYDHRVLSLPSFHPPRL